MKAYPALTVSYIFIILQERFTGHFTALCLRHSQGNARWYKCLTQSSVSNFFRWADTTRNLTGDTSFWDHPQSGSVNICSVFQWLRACVLNSLSSERWQELSQVFVDIKDVCRYDKPLFLYRHSSNFMCRKISNAGGTYYKCIENSNFHKIFHETANYINYLFT